MPSLAQGFSAMYVPEMFITKSVKLTKMTFIANTETLITEIWNRYNTLKLFSLIIAQNL